MSNQPKTVFDKNNPYAEVESLNHLNRKYIMDYLAYQVEIGNKEKVQAYADECLEKPLKEKKRLFALRFMPDLLAHGSITFDMELKTLLNKPADKN